MINLIGTMPGRTELLRHPGVHLHDYAKQPRPGRKLGHLTLVEADAGRCERRTRRLLAELAPQIHIP
jgi:5-(carboxyamino)imidazole ribonucleotide synthase